MRVAWLCGHWPSPTETFLAREIEALASAGIEVVPVAFRAAGTPDPRALYRPVCPRPAELAALSRAPCAAGGVLAACLAAPTLGVAARWLRNMPFAAWLAGWCRRVGVELVHAAWSGVPAQVAWMCRRFGGPLYTVAAHARDVFAPPEAAPIALTEAAGVVVCNRAARDALTSRLPALADRLVHIPHGLPLERFPLRTTPPTTPPLILGVGRLVAKKGFDTLIEAVATLVAAGQAVKVMILGEGPERERLARRATERGVCLALHGHVDESEVSAALAAATALALPSRVAPDGDRDGLANVLLEAMAVGTPVVTTTAGSATDAVTDGETGLLVPPDDSAALAAALRRLLDDPALGRRLAAAARARVELDFDVSVNAARLAAWLREAATRATRSELSDAR